jgi:hypothetical protein
LLAEGKIYSTFLTKKNNMKKIQQNKYRTNKLENRANYLLKNYNIYIPEEYKIKFNNFLKLNNLPTVNIPSKLLSRSLVYKILQTSRITKKQAKLIRKQANIDRNTKKPKKRDNPRSYKSYIASDLWTARKNRYYRTHSRICTRCTSTSFIELHHMFYDSKSFGYELDEHLIPLCKECHELFHSRFGSKKNMLADTKLFIETKSIDDLPPEKEPKRKQKGKLIEITL